MASSDAYAAAASADLRLRAALAAPTLPAFSITNVGAVPPQEGPTQPTSPTTDVGAVLPQWGDGPTRRTVRGFPRRSRVRPFWRCIISMTRRRCPALVYFMDRIYRRPWLTPS